MKPFHQLTILILFHGILLKTLIEIKSYKGLRRLSNLPVRGQRTHTNAKTAKRLKNYNK